jgi:hypothetical protein
MKEGSGEGVISVCDISLKRMNDRDVQSVAARPSGSANTGATTDAARAVVRALKRAVGY